jgi:signal transduction histidine kinase
MNARRVHDIGGLDAGAIELADHPTERWQIEVNATFGALMSPARRVIRLDEIRRAVEDLGPERYETLGYFERQTQAAADLLVEKGVLGRDEIERRIRELRSRAREK